MFWDSQRTGLPGKQPQRGILRSALKKTSRPQPSYHIRKPYIQKEEEDDNEELLVFGYACKIFPPDDHAKNIARLNHLIPWNGDENLQLMIDRYDGRASLHDLSEFDVDSWNIHYEKSEEDARIEQLCDQERYMALYTDIAEEKIRHEEELKRLHASIAGEETSSFKEVGFNYDSQQAPIAPKAENPAVQEKAEVEDEHEEKPFMAPSALAVPSDMEIPPTVKMHAIIEKTANFVSNQGAQMEIVLKAKQANNSQFLFLNYDHYLNPYYKNMVKRIKEGKYRPGMKDEHDKKEIEEEESESDSDNEGGYLHPSLFASSSAANKKREEENKEKFKAIQKVDPNHPLAKLIEKGRKANALKQYTMMKNAVQNYNPGAEDALEPPPLPQFLENEDSRSSSTTSSPVPTQEHDAIHHSMTPQEAAMVIVPPPPDIQPMVDSIAKQIAEEGDAVELRLKSQNDPMLAFLLPSHELHPYYTFRKTYIREQIKAQQRLLLQQQQTAAEKTVDESAQVKSAPISFSIKVKKENSSKPTMIQNRLQALGGDDEDELEEGDDKGNNEENREAGKENENKENENENSTTNEETTLAILTAKRKFVEEPDDSVVDVAPDIIADDKITEKRPRRKFTLTPQPLPSNFTVVTPTGERVSITEFREKQAERRQKASMFLQKKNQDSAEELPVVSSSAKVTNDIFDIFEDDDPSISSNTVTTTDTATTSIPINADNAKKSAEPDWEAEVSKEPSARISPAKSISSSSSRSPTMDRKSSPALEPATVPTTLKDLIAAASRSSTPSHKNKKNKKRHRSRSRSRSTSKSKSRSRHSSPRDYSGKRWSRSRSRDRDYLPSSYRRVLGSSRDNETSYRYSSQHSRYNKDIDDVPSAYKIENPQPSSYGNGNSSRRDREISPYYKSRKRYRQELENEEGKKKRRSRKSPSHKSSKKKKSSSKSKKKHKKKKSKSKKKKERETSSEEGEYGSNSDDDNDSSDESDNVSKVYVVETKPVVDKEEGELSPQQDKELLNVPASS
uniref:splicing factor, suppressor of white-apricot homolog isoform X1 n=2 Tax=Styela clava TaxID=7725 RepID=UPI00193A8852|nr:splicing factor, suppressor of white-apricot homolog isoform X1 [Styela clava]XP_039267594.1 splicing factor, suppressor of white-apricot homolog isoform X1 [Styela clava]